MDTTAVQDTVSTATKLVSSASYDFSWFMFDNNLVYYIALAIGFFIIFTSYWFGGGKTNRVKIVLSIATGVIIGVLTLPLLLKISGSDKPLLVAFFVLMDIIFTATVTCHMYELVVVGTHEAFDQSPMR